MVFSAPGLIPARFLTLLSHLTVLILIFFSREQNVEACMVSDWTENDFNSKDAELKIGIIASMILTGIEFIGYLSGVSTFNTSTALVSTGSHFIGSVALSHFILDEWDCDLFWWIFRFCSVLPAAVEIINGIKVLVLRKY